MSKIIQGSTSHFQNESELWKRSLEYIRQENSYLKNQLADIVIQDISTEFLYKAEEFQNRFIIKDEMIETVQRNIYEFNNWIYDHLRQDNKDNDKYFMIQKKLRNEIEQLEQRFINLKFEFPNYLPIPDNPVPSGFPGAYNHD